MKNEKLYNIFMDLIGRLSNDEIKRLIDNLQEYINNDEESEEN